MRRTLRNVPPRRHDIGYEPDLTVPAADGSPLLADRYFPLADGDFATLLVRSPYGRGLPWAPLYGALFAEQGFHVVLQSCRGAGGSGDGLAQWRTEAADGQATVTWLREQPWFSGVLGTVGPSYMGYVQWALALDPPPELRAMVIQMGIHDPHRFFYSDGAFSLESALIASTALVHQGRGAWHSVRATMRLQRRLRRVTVALPLIEAYVPAIGERVPFLEEAMTHPGAGDVSWQGTDTGAAADRSTVPTCLITGWNDLQLDQVMQQHGRLRRTGCDTALLVGPWTHTSALGQGLPEVFAETLAWLRAHLRDDSSSLRPTPVRVHVGGSNVWRDLPDWPPRTTSDRWYLHGDGTLATHVPDASPPLTFHYDPADPTPSLGGPLLTRKAGTRDNTALEARDDVLVFTSAPLTEPIEILGPVSTELRVVSSTGHGDVFVRLCDVDPRGRSHNICDGLLRLGPHGSPGPATIQVTMSSTAYRFSAGHRIRLQVSGGAHPRFARNTGTGEPFATTTRLVPVDITIHHPSALLVPLWRTRQGARGANVSVAPGWLGHVRSA